jgi:DNA-binding response OmpR family regulator
MKILIIDDDEEYCAEMIQLIKAEGFEVDVAFDGISGLSMAHHGQYPIILLDLKLPRLDGYQVLKKIRENQKSVKIIILSGRPLGETLLERENLTKEEEDRLLSLADAVLSKPFVISELLEHIRKFTFK